MQNLFFVCVAALALLGGCCSPRGMPDCGNDPIVAPTNIPTEVQGDGEPTLPPYVPWWAEEEKSCR